MWSQWGRVIRRSASSVVHKPFPVLPPPVTSVSEADWNGKVLVWDRIRRILDPDAGADFLELGATVGLDLPYGDVPAGGTITGVGRIHGNHIMIVANDATVKGGTSYPITVTKSLRAQEIAHQLRLPTLYVVDTGGAFLPLQSEIFPDVKHGGRTFRNQAVMSGEGIPQIALVSGMCTAGGAYTPTMSDEAIMVNKIANIYLGGPPLVRAATGEIVTGEELGGARLHCGTSGIADHFAETEEESFEIVRDIVATLNMKESYTPSTAADAPLGTAEELIAWCGSEVLGKPEMYGVLRAIVDGSRFTEFKRTFGGHLICGFAFLEGQLVGIAANCGDITREDAQKGAHFMQLCDQRDLPIIFLQNSSNSRHEADPSQETLRERAKFVQAQSVARVPKISLALSSVSQDELFTMCGPSFGPSFYFMWPGAGLAKEQAMGPRPCDTDPTDVAFGNAQFWTSRNTCDGIIKPQETRQILSKAVYLSCLNYTASHHRTTSTSHKLNDELVPILDRGASLSELDSHLVEALVHGLAGSHDERDSFPAWSVNVEHDRGESGRERLIGHLGIVRVAQLGQLVHQIGVAHVLSKDHILQGYDFDSREELGSLVAEVTIATLDGFHGNGTQDLQQMILHHIPDDPSGIKVAGPSKGAKALLERDQDPRNGFIAPSPAQGRIGQSQKRDNRHHFQPEIMIDLPDLINLEKPIQMSLEILKGRQVRAKGLL
eukprot:maker-scaffold29_size597861-snap-gene-0.11 protein:Tk04643 transcript:maker-scaffold29_size597861-snap-gene-0.11-mRNA-1 annotation:"probable methylcrotonoyl- carboxylase beta mitochondrial-like"